MIHRHCAFARIFVTQRSFSTGKIRKSSRKISRTHERYDSVHNENADIGKIQQWGWFIAKDMEKCRWIIQKWDGIRGFWVFSSIQAHLNFLIIVVTLFLLCLWYCPFHIDDYIRAMSNDKLLVEVKKFTNTILLN